MTDTHRFGLAVSVLVLMLLSGCTFARDRIVYRDPTTGDEQVCLRPPAIAMGPADIPERNRYAACKTKWEGQGYVRTTVEN